MRKNLIIFLAITGMIFGFISCESFIENKITVDNSSASNIELLIAGKSYDIPSNSNLVLSDFKKGTFAYQTIYTVPFGVTTATAEGDVSGEITLLAGTEVLLKYTSFASDSSYTIYGILSSSDDVNSTDPFADK